MKQVTTSQFMELEIFYLTIATESLQGGIEEVKKCVEITGQELSIVRRQPVIRDIESQKYQRNIVIEQ